MQRGIAIAIVVLVATPAAAQPTEAVRLFDEGRELARAGNYSAACQKFAKSFELDRGLGIEVNLADCNEHLGHVALAWHMFRHVVDEAQRTGDMARLQLGKTRLSELAKRVGTLSIRVADPALPGLTITLDGRALTPGPAIREVVDPSSVEIVATAPGRQRFVRASHVGAGETVIVDVDLAPDMPTGGAGGPTTQRRRSWVHAALGGGALAAAGVITGAVLAIDAKLKYDNATGDSAHCTPGNPPQCDSVGQAAIDRSQRIATIGTGFFIGAAAIGAAAAVIYFTAPRDVVVTASPTSIGIAGRF